MKEEIHPEFHTDAVVRCACGNTWTTGSTVAEIRTDVCAACHPFYTGEQRIVDTEGRVDRFYRRLEQARARQSQASGAAEADTSEETEE
jgi:large subunit ribosomal protein L31